MTLKLLSWSWVPYFGILDSKENRLNARYMCQFGLMRHSSDCTFHFQTFLNIKSCSFLYHLIFTQLLSYLKEILNIHPIQLRTQRHRILVSILPTTPLFLLSVPLSYIQPLTPTPNAHNHIYFQEKRKWREFIPWNWITTVEQRT